MFKKSEKTQLEQTYFISLSLGLKEPLEIVLIHFSNLEKGRRNISQDKIDSALFVARGFFSLHLPFSVKPL